MAVKIRLARRGRKKRPFYHIVVADARSPRDGKYIDSIGTYNPMTVPATIDLDREKAFEWLQKGAQPTDTARALLKFKGVYYRKHLLRGVAKGAMTEEKAMELYQEWIDIKEARVAARVEKTRKSKEDFWKMLSGEIKPSKKAASKDAGDAFRAAAAAETADQPEVDEAPEVAPVEETPVVAEETPVVAEETPEVVAEDAKEVEKTDGE